MFGIFLQNENRLFYPTNKMLVTLKLTVNKIIFVRTTNFLCGQAIKSIHSC